MRLYRNSEIHTRLYTTRKWTQYLSPNNYDVDDHGVAGDIEQVNTAYMSRTSPFGDASAFPGSTLRSAHIIIFLPQSLLYLQRSLYHPPVSLSRTNPTTSLHQSPVSGPSREYSTNYQLLTELKRHDTEVSSTVAGTKRAAPIDLSSHHPDGGSTSSKVTRYESMWYCSVKMS